MDVVDKILFIALLPVVVISAPAIMVVSAIGDMCAAFISSQLSEQ